jgi:hypothetical protein
MLGINLGEYAPGNKDQQTTVKNFHLKTWDEDNTELKLTIKISRRDKNGDTISDSQATTDTDVSFEHEDANSDDEDATGEEDVFDDSIPMSTKTIPKKVIPKVEEKTPKIRNGSLVSDAFTGFDPSLAQTNLTTTVVEKDSKRKVSKPGHHRQGSISATKEKVSPKISIIESAPKEEVPKAEIPKIEPKEEVKEEVEEASPREEIKEELPMTEFRSKQSPRSRGKTNPRSNSTTPGSGSVSGNKKKLNIPKTNLLTVETPDVAINTPLLQEALGELSKQEEELLALTRKLETQKRDSKERILIEMLISTIQPEFNKGIPSSAVLLYKCLTEFNCFNVNEHSQFPQKIIKSIKQMIDVN